MSSITDTIDQLIQDSQEAARECRWFLKAIPGICAVEVMGENIPGTPEVIQKENDRGRFARLAFANDAGILTDLLPNIRPDQYEAIETAVANYGRSLIGSGERIIDQSLKQLDIIATTDEAKALCEKTKALVGLSERLDQQWTSIKSSEAIGRIHSAKERADVKDDMDKSVAKVIELYKRKDIIAKAMQELMDEQEADLIAKRLTSQQVRNNKDKISLYTQQLNSINKQLSIHDFDKLKDVKLQVPTNLDSGKKGQQLITFVDSFVDEYRSAIPIVRLLVKRIGHDIHPDSGLFWGHMEYDSNSSKEADEGLNCIPTESNGYMGIPSFMVERYKKESKWFCDVLRKSFQTTHQIEIFERVFQLFKCGILGDEDALCSINDGTFAYWSLLSLTRPADEEHRNKVEEELNRSYMLLYKHNMSWEKAIHDTRPLVVEAKLLGIRIKWMYTGRK